MAGAPWASFARPSCPCVAKHVSAALPDVLHVTTLVSAESWRRCRAPWIMHVRLPVQAELGGSRIRSMRSSASPARWAHSAVMPVLHAPSATLAASMRWSLRARACPARQGEGAASTARSARQCFASEGLRDWPKRQRSGATHLPPAPAPHMQHCNQRHGRHLLL